MAGSIPYIPPEIILGMLSAAGLEIADLLRCTRVNKEWRCLVYDSNNLRARLFLPRRSTSGEMVKVTDPQYTGVVEFCFLLDNHDDEGRFPTTDNMLSGSLRGVALHPLLAMYRDKSKHNNHIMFRYDVLRQLRHLYISDTRSWHDMCVTEPPLSRIFVVSDYLQCKDFDKSRGDLSIRPSTGTEIENPTGVTLREVFNIIWETAMPRNLGLVEDDMNCEGSTLIGSDEKQCICYDTFRLRKRAQARMDTAEHVLEDAKKMYDESRNQLEEGKWKKRDYGEAEKEHQAAHLNLEWALRIQRNLTAAWRD
jgi:hypothetical protein